MENILTGEKLYDKIANLKMIRTDGVHWESYYLDESTHEKWVEQYPNSGLHGGGAPQLKKIEKFPWE